MKNFRRQGSIREATVLNSFRLLRVAALRPALLALVLAPALLLLAGCRLPIPEFPFPDISTNTPAPFVTIEISTSQAYTPEPTDMPSPTPTRFSTPTPEVGGSVLNLKPESADVGWFGNADNRRNHIGDSFLYAGFYDEQAYISAIRFDLSTVPRGAPIRELMLVLTGITDDRLDPEIEGSWTLQVLAPPDIEPNSLAQTDFQELYNTSATVTLIPSIGPDDLAVGRINHWVFDASTIAWLEQQLIDGIEEIIIRISGPVGGDNTLFGWDAGVGQATSREGPQLIFSLGQKPDTPPPLPTQPVIIATLTPTPENVMTVAVDALTATVVATTIGTYTPVPGLIQTPTPIPEGLSDAQAAALSQGLAPIVIHTPTPANQATAEAQTFMATAIAVTTGTLTPVPLNAITPIIVTPTPIPENVATAAVQMLTAVAQIAKQGTGTPLPYNVIIATVTRTPPILTRTPTPENRATRQAFNAYATAVAITTGTFTPIPSDAVFATATATPTAIPLVIFRTPTPIPTATPVPYRIPNALRGNILFFSNRPVASGLPSTGLWALEPGSGRLAYVTDMWVYNRAAANDKKVSKPEGNYSVSVEPDGRNIEEIFVTAHQYNAKHQVTPLTGMSYDPAWSPGGDWIAFVTNENGNDEIYVVGRDGNDMRRLTFNDWEWDKHPSYSPNGSQIAFFSNRNGRNQLWIMNADGSNQRLLLSSPYDDWAPVWIK